MKTASGIDTVHGQENVPEWAHYTGFQRTFRHRGIKVSVALSPVVMMWLQSGIFPNRSCKLVGTTISRNLSEAFPFRRRI